MNHFSATENTALTTIAATTAATPAGFIVAQCGGPIYGFGATEADARAMASKWGISDSSGIRPYTTGRMVIGAMFIAPATADLIELVKECGGDVGYRVIDGVAVAAENGNEHPLTALHF